MATVLLDVAFIVMGHGIAPDRTTGYPGHYVGLFIASALPVSAASVTSSMLAKRGGRRCIAVVAGTVVGLLLVIYVPYMLFALGCLFTPVCP